MEQIIERESNPTDNDNVQKMRNCLFCLEEVKLVWEGRSTQPTISLLSLSRYLGIELGRAPLCERCALLNEDFSKLYGQLERIRMEMASCLHRVHATLLRKEAVAGGGTGGDEKAAVDGLRSRVAQRCSNRLRRAPPRVTLKKLSGDITPESIVKIEMPRSPTPSISSHIFPASGSEPGRVLKDPLEDDEGATESPDQMQEGEPGPGMKCDICFLTVDDLSTHLHTSHFDDPIKEEPKPEPEVAGPHQNLEESLPSVGPFTVELPPITVALAVTTKTKLVPMTVAPAGQPGEGCSSIVPYSLKLKLRCDICNKLLSNRSAYLRHYKSVHLNIKHECEICGKGFQAPFGLAKHRDIVHFGVRYKCEKCGGTFTQRSYLAKHQREVCAGNILT